MVKPVLKFLTRKQRTNSVTPSSCNYDISESVQNHVNETEPFQLHFQFYEETADNLANEAAEAEENLRNEELERRLMENVEQNSTEDMGIQKIVDGEIVVEPVVTGTYFAVPVHFVESAPGQFMWAPLPDSDICYRGNDSPISECQKPEQQVPITTCVSAA